VFTLHTARECDRDLRRFDLRLHVQCRVPPVRQRLCQQYRPAQLRNVVVQPVQRPDERLGDVQRNGLRDLVRGDVSRVRRQLPEQQQHRFVRFVVRGMRSARERRLDLQRHGLRLHVQRWLPSLRRDVRQQHASRQLRQLLHGVFSAGQRLCDV
jgi:hypothetical protein